MEFRNALHALAWYLWARASDSFVPGVTEQVASIMAGHMADGGPDEDPLNEDRLIALADIEKMLNRFSERERRFLCLYAIIGFEQTFHLYAGTTKVRTYGEAPKTKREALARQIAQEIEDKWLKEWEDRPCWERCLECGRNNSFRCFASIANRNKHRRGAAIINRFEEMLREGDYLCS